MKTRLLALLLVTGGFALAETHISIGIGVGPGYGYGYAPRAVAAYRSPCPGPGYVWINGYYDGYGRWFEGYWAMPPYGGAYWAEPRFNSGRYSSGYWGGSPAYGRDYDRGENRRRDVRDHDRGGREDRGRGDSFRGRGRR
jgi:hypothetical protein